HNILVTTNGIAKLVDFGVAKAQGRLMGDTIGGSLKGKLHYMAPEQANGSPVDARADVWGAGAVLYHLLTGAPPYQREDDMAIFRALLQGEAPEPLPSSMPRALVDVLNMALDADPACRFPSALAFQEALEHAAR